MMARRLRCSVVVTAVVVVAVADMVFGAEAR